MKSCTTIDPGFVGVQSYMGQIQEKTLTPGFHWKQPLINVIHMDTRIHVNESDYKAASKDMQDVIVRMALNYSLKSETASSMYQDVGMD